MEWLNFHHLRYFWTVAREGSVARAAARLHVSQPAISEQIGELERALGQPLFRREGRRKVLTDVGQMVLGYADGIFTLGEELLSSVRARGTGRAMRLHVGVVDSLPKLLANLMLKPVFAMKLPVHVVCREGKLEDLVSQLVLHRLDVLLSDEAAGGGLGTRTFNHRLGESTLTFCAAPTLARALKRGFPRSLHEAPALLPAVNTSSGRSLARWFETAGIRPRVLAEFEDLALMKALATDGKGFIALPTVALEEACAHYGFEPVGIARNCREQFYAITAERRLVHPAVVEITRHAQETLT